MGCLLVRDLRFRGQTRQLVEAQRNNRLILQSTKAENCSRQSCIGFRLGSVQRAGGDGRGAHSQAAICFTALIFSHAAPMAGCPIGPCWAQVKLAAILTAAFLRKMSDNQLSDQANCRTRPRTNKGLGVSQPSLVFARFCRNPAVRA